MARRKKPVVRRRRVSGIGSSNVQTIAGIALGAIASRLLISKLASTLDPKISSAVQVGAGILLSGMKQPLVKAAGYGILATGVVSAGQSFGLIAGVGGLSSWQQNLPSNEMANIAGYEGLNYIGNPQGSPEMSVISGLGNPQGDAELQVIAGMSEYCS